MDESGSINTPRGQMDYTSQIAALQQRVAIMEKKAWLAAHDVGFFSMWNGTDHSGPPKIALLCNDTFAWATADCEDVLDNQLDEVIALYKSDGEAGVIRWIANQRNMKPLESTEKWLAGCDAIKSERDALQQQLLEWKRALHSLTPGGSEYADDSQACVKWVRETRSRQHETIIEGVKQRKELQQQLDAAQAECRVLDGKYVNEQAAKDRAQDEADQYYRCLQIEKGEHAQAIRERDVAVGALVMLQRRFEATQRERDDVIAAASRPTWVCQRCGRVSNDGWLVSSYQCDALHGSVQCPDCQSIDLEQNTAKELASICTKVQSQLATVTAERDAAKHDAETYHKMYAAGLMDRAVLENELTTLRALVGALFKFKCQDIPEQFNAANAMYEQGDEGQSFFSEAYLYVLIGKEDARSLLALVQPLRVAVSNARKEWSA